MHIDKQSNLFLYHTKYHCIDAPYMNYSECQSMKNNNVQSQSLPQNILCDKTA